MKKVMKKKSSRSFILFPNDWFHSGCLFMYTLLEIFVSVYIYYIIFETDEDNSIGHTLFKFVNRIFTDEAERNRCHYCEFGAKEIN